MPAPLVWSQDFRVRAYEVGGGDLASPLAVVDYVQEAAGEHARALGVERFEIGEAGGAWVLARMAVRFERLPLWRERVTVETWPSGRDGLRATRDVLLRDDADEILARARTVWFVLDVARRRPVRLPSAVLALDPPERPAALDLPPTPTPPETIRQSATFTVRHLDLDRNEHANNARFARWALDAADQDPSRLSMLDLAFRSEAVLGDGIVSNVGEAGDGTLAHAILRASDRRLLATARTLWT